MTFALEVGGRPFTVIIQPLAQRNRFRVLVNGEPRVVTATPGKGCGISLLTECAVPEDAVSQQKETVTASTSAEFHLVPGAGRGDLLVFSGGRTIEVSVNTPRSAHADGEGHGHGPVTILAPMPGRIVRILASPGDEVAARQPIVVVEAMKMENELRAPRAGRVKEIAVAPGTSVDAGRVLAVIE